MVILAMIVLKYVQTILLSPPPEGGGGLDEVLTLINVLDVNFGIKASINKRTNSDGKVK